MQKPPNEPSQARREELLCRAHPDVAQKKLLESLVGIKCLHYVGQHFHGGHVVHEMVRCFVVRQAWSYIKLFKRTEVAKC